MTTVTGEKIFCPFCGLPLPLWVGDSRWFVPVMSQTGDFSVKCRSRKCHARLVYIDIRRPVLIG